MKRRQFLKRCGLLPFVGSLATVAQSETPESTLGVEPLKILNGQVFEAPWPLCHTVIVQYFGRCDQWILLSSPYPAAQHEGSAMIPCYYERKDGSDNPFYTQLQLQEKLKDWKLLKGEQLILYNYKSTFYEHCQPRRMPMYPLGTRRGGKIYVKAAEDIIV